MSSVARPHRPASLAHLDGERHRLAIDADAAGQRLDRVLAARLPGLSRSRIKALIEQGHVVAEAGAGRAPAGQTRATITEPSRRVKPGEVYLVHVPKPVAAEPEAQALPLTVLYEDDDLLVIDKAPGMVVHPAPGNADRTLVNALLAHCGPSLSGIGGVRRPGIVHRLDKDTSGVMVVAKNDAAHRALSEAFAGHNIERAYKALVWGAPSPRQGRIEGRIGRSPRNRKKMAVVSRGGKPAATDYRVLQSWGPADQPAASLVECTLHTGRTHQVRVHMASIGHPLVGDPLYGRARKMVKGWEGMISLLKAFPRQALHAFRLGFAHPGSGSPMAFQSDLPRDFNKLLAALNRLRRPVV